MSLHPPDPADDTELDPSRRAFLTSGALVVAFSLWPKDRIAQAAASGTQGSAHSPAPLPRDLKEYPWLDSWIRVESNGGVTVFTGKVELGQGIRTALSQVAAEELDMPPARVKLITADTSITPDEGLTAGSHSMPDSGAAILNAAANVRGLLTRAAARRWGIDAGTVRTNGDGTLRAPDGRTVSYGRLAAALSLHVQAAPDAPLRSPAQFRTIGQPLARVDIPAKLTGGPAYVQDLSLPGMWHARVVRGPSFGTRLQALDVQAISTMADVQVVRNGAFIALTSPNEWRVVRALQRLQGDFERTSPPLPTGGVAQTLRAMPAHDITILDKRSAAAPGELTVTARYTRPWLCHASIGPSCAVAWYRHGTLTVWSHSQGVFNLQRAIAQLLQLPLARVRCIHVEGSGCYGHNGADDVAADAAVVAMATPGRPIRLQWMREQEFGWEPLGPAMLGELSAALDAQGRIVSWRHELWSNEHNARPMNAGGLLAGAELRPAFPIPASRPIPMPEGGASRNSNPIYALPNMAVTYHFIAERVMRASALRSLGAHFNVFCIESLLDELARARSLDPLALRLSHLTDQRARTVLQTAADAFGWSGRLRGNAGRGCGIGFARYKNLATYCAVLMQVAVDRASGHIHVERAVAAVDSGQIVNPDGLRNQIEGGIVQSISWTTLEELALDASGRRASSWGLYPILRFENAPDSVEVHLIDRPGKRSWAPAKQPRDPPQRRWPTRWQTPRGCGCGIYP